MSDSTRQAMTECGPAGRRARKLRSASPAFCARDSLSLSIFGAEPAGAGRREHGTARTQAAVEVCRHCGAAITRAAMTRLPITADDGATAGICPLCHLCLHLERPEIEREALVIWLPEFAQGAVNALAREIHLTLAAHDRPLCIDPRSVDTDAAVESPLLRGALAAYAALAERRAAATARLGTASPRELGHVLAALSPGFYERRATLLAGARLLPLGRFFVDGADIYPGLLGGFVARGRPGASKGAPGRQWSSLGERS